MNAFDRPRTALGGNLAVDIVNAAGINPADVQQITAGLKKLVADADAVTQEAKTILGPLDSLISSLSSSPPVAARRILMSTVPPPSALADDDFGAVRFAAIRAARQSGGVRAALTVRQAFADQDFCDELSTRAAAQFAAFQAAPTTGGLLGGGTSTGGTPSRPILTWLGHGGLQWILQVVMQLLPIFGIPVPGGITIPPMPTPVSTTTSQLDTRTGEELLADTDDHLRTAMMAPPPWLISLAEQALAGAVNAAIPAIQTQVVPAIKQEIRDWLASLKNMAAAA